MWDKLFGWVRFLWNAGEETERTSAQGKRNQEQIEQLTQLVKLLIVGREHDRQLHQQEMQALHEKMADEQEKMELCLRLEISV